MTFNYQQLLELYFIDAGRVSIKPFGSGLINHTMLVEHEQDSKRFILQKINTHVFPEPGKIMGNIAAVGDFLFMDYPEYVFLKPFPALDGKQFVWYRQECFRLFPFVENSLSYDIPQNAEQARVAAAAFGKFSAHLNNFPSETLNITIPDFHNLHKRYVSFQKALSEGNPQRLAQTKTIADELLNYAHLVGTYTQIVETGACNLRVMHHDTKISNVLFDQNGKVICLVDLDTIMPGYFISDVGDMMRNYLSAAGEEETDFSKIKVRMDYFEALATGYLYEMAAVLTPTEKTYFVYSGLFITYMQALRFYTDYLMNDVYYPVKHSEHNLVRTQNQLVLLGKMVEVETEMEAFVTGFKG
jgi:hypothetical protein